MKAETPCLLVITPGFPANEEDTECLPWVQSFITKLNDSRPEVKIIVFALEYPFKKERYKWFSNEVQSFNSWKKSKLYKIYSWLGIWHRLGIINNEYRICGIISYWCGEAAYVGNFFARRKGVKHIIRICGQDASKENKWVRRIRPKSSEL